MPKVPTLYSHSAQSATAHQVAVSIDSSGRRSYVVTSSQISLPSLAPEAHPEGEDADYPRDVNMEDIDDIDNPPNSTEAADEDATIEVMPGVHVQISTPKAKRYANSVGFILIGISAISDSIIHRMFLLRLGQVAGMTILTSAWHWRAVAASIPHVQVVGSQCPDIGVKTA
jgi:hypothetical protein